jgi:hypothetical protein
MNSLATLILQLIEFVLSAIDPHEEYGTDCRQHKRNDCIHSLGSDS